MQQISREAVTDGTGTAVFADVPEGPYDVKVRAFAYKVWPSYDEVVSSQSKGRLVTLSPGELGCMPLLTVDYDNAEPRKRPVRGAVVDEDSHKGVGGAKIMLRLLDGSGKTTTVFSGMYGKFEITDLSPCHYRARVIKDGFNETDVKLVVPAQDDAVVSI